MFNNISRVFFHRSFELFSLLHIFLCCFLVVANEPMAPVFGKSKNIFVVTNFLFDGIICIFIHAIRRNRVVRRLRRFHKFHLITRRLLMFRLFARVLIIFSLLFRSDFCLFTIPKQFLLFRCCWFSVFARDWIANDTFSLQKLNASMSVYEYYY